MAGAPKGNQNARKHGLWSKKARAVQVLTSAEAGIQLQDPRRAIRYLEGVMDEIVRRMQRAKPEEFTRLANSLALAATALFNGHRTVTYLTGEMSPVEDALRELEALDFAED